MGGAGYRAVERGGELVEDARVAGGGEEFAGVVESGRAAGGREARGTGEAVYGAVGWIDVEVLCMLRFVRGFGFRVLVGTVVSNCIVQCGRGLPSGYIQTALQVAGW